MFSSVILIGTKSDLRDNSGPDNKSATKSSGSLVPYSEGEAVARRIGAVTYMVRLYWCYLTDKYRVHLSQECSALTQAGLKQAFDSTILAIVNRPKQASCGCTIL